MLLNILIIILLVTVGGLAFLVWRAWTRYEEINGAYSGLKLCAERLKSERDVLALSCNQLTSEKDRAFRRMRKAEALLDEYRSQGYCQFDFAALQNDYIELEKKLGAAAPGHQAGLKP